MNAYEMIEQIRYNIGETVAAHWGDRQLLRQLNLEHMDVARKVLDSPGDWLLTKSDSITPSSSQLALPSDCVKPAAVEEVSSGRVVPISTTIRERRISRMSGTSLSSGVVEAYLIGNYIEVNQESFTEPCYIWYQKRVVELHMGECGASSGATAVHFELANWPSGVDDYYNGVVVQVRDQTDNVLNVNEAISDYAGQTGIATIADPTVTPASGDFYGTVSQLPEELMPWIILRTTTKALARPSSTFEKEIFGFFKNELRNVESEAQEFLCSRISGSTYSRVAEEY